MMLRLTLPVSAAGAMALLLAVSGCSSLLPARAPASDLYQLSPLSLSERSGRPIAGQIVVEVPLAARGIDTDRIVVRSGANEIRYLAGARWTDRAPKLVQTALVQGLESAHGFTGVGRPGDGLRGTYALLSELRSFEVVSAGQGTTIEVVLAVRLVRAPGGDVLATRLVRAVAEPQSRGAADVVKAFDSATNEAASETIQFALASAAAAKPADSTASAPKRVAPEAPTP